MKEQADDRERQAMGRSRRGRLVVNRENAILVHEPGFLQMRKAIRCRGR